MCATAGYAARLHKELQLKAFPKELAKIITERWDHMVAGDYLVPPIPPNRLLRELIETAYVAAAVPDEGRYPQFNIVAFPAAKTNENKSLGQVWNFADRRPLSVEEIRRLAPAVDLKKSAILTEWDANRWYIAGLVDLGTSWNRARIGLQYHYQFPPCLFLQIDRIGRIRAYQGQFLIAALVDGELERRKGFELSMALHAPVDNGLRKIWPEITYPKIEEPREYENFQFIAFWNTLAALANCIGEEAHGGAVVIVPAGKSASVKQLRIKYRQDASTLKNSFIEFMSIRHRVADFVVRIERGEELVKGDWALAELDLAERHLRLVEAIRFVARLACCDGAIVISEDLRLLGFGAEIRSELKSKTIVREVKDEMRKLYEPLNIEAFGLRHRSAIKLVSQEPTYSVLVISQDGPISVVWSEQDRFVTVKRGANLVNLNMPWA